MFARASDPVMLLLNGCSWEQSETRYIEVLIIINWLKINSGACGHSSALRDYRIVCEILRTERIDLKGILAKTNDLVTANRLNLLVKCPDKSNKVVVQIGCEQKIFFFMLRL